MVVGMLSAFSMVAAYYAFGGLLLLLAILASLGFGLKLTKQIAMEYVGSLVMPTEEEIEELRQAFMAMAEEDEEEDKENED